MKGVEKEKEVELVKAGVEEKFVVKPRSRNVRGVVDFWNESRGFGFIGITRAQRYWFHVSSIVDGPLGDLTGLWATFDVKPSPKGERWEALNVQFESRTPIQQRIV
jgi:cold shock CspA family protein